MTPDEITRAFQTYFNQAWTTTPVAYDNVPFDIPQGQSWLRCSVRPGMATGDEAGDNGVALRSGATLVQVFTPVNTGSQDGGALAGQVEALFRKTTLPGSIYCEEPYTTEVGVDKDSSMYLHLVSVPWWCWTL